MAKYRVVLRRANGRYVREWPARSKYAAKKIRQRQEDKYDSAFYLEIEETKDERIHGHGD